MPQKLTLKPFPKRRRKLDDEGSAAERFSKRKSDFEEAIDRRYRATDVMRGGPERVQELLLFYGKEAKFFEDAAAQCQSFSREAADILFSIREQVERWSKFLQAFATPSHIDAPQQTVQSSCRSAFPTVSVGKTIHSRF